MAPDLRYIAAILVAYVVVVLAVGAVASRRSSRSPDEYFLAGRALGPFVLFMALFGTNATAFVLVGIPGKAYLDGLGTFGVNAPLIALGVPLTFWLIGAPARRMAARLGALTPAELYAKRFARPALGVVLFAVFTLYTVPYMVTAVKGAALTLTGVTGGQVPEWLGGLGVVVVAVVYTSLGGMRATAWTNVIQGCIFLAFVIVAVVVMAISMGGPQAAMEAVAARDPQLLTVAERPLFSPQGWASWGMAISLTVIAFPHMLARLMAGSGDRALTGACRAYPPALIALWVPVVLIGVWGAAEFPGLPTSDLVFSKMVARHLPPALASLGFLAVLAAVMSTLDAQILTLGSMLTRDVLDVASRREHQSRAEQQARDRRDVRRGRIFGVAVAALVYIVAQLVGASIFDIARLAFSGYVTLVPTLFLGVRWKRFTASGALASIVAGNVVLALGEAGWIPLGGFLPVFWAVLLASLVAVAVSLAGKPPDPQATERAFAG